MERKEGEKKSELEMMPRETLEKPALAPLPFQQLRREESGDWRLDNLQLFGGSYFHSLSHGIETNFENLTAALDLLGGLSEAQSPHL